MKPVAMNRVPLNTSASLYRRTAIGIALIGLLAWWLADISITTTEPGLLLRQLLAGLMRPDFFATDQLASALGMTLAFALQGVALAIAVGLLLALCWRWRAVRALCAIVRAIHELFWGLIFLQIFGLSTLTGLLAIAVPYSGIFGKVFAELLEESDPAPAQALASDSPPLSVLLFARMPLIWAHIKSYGAYRLECAIRASTLLGFIGLPTLGFHLDTALRQGHYAEGAALLYLLLALIFSQRLWLRARLMPLWLTASLILASPQARLDSTQLWRFLGSDIVPAPLRDSSTTALWPWLSELVAAQMLPGLINTLIVAGAALLLTALLALLAVPLVSRQFGNPISRAGGQLLLVVGRSLPEFLLAFLLVVWLGPSMLPGIIALAIHTGAIVGHLNARLADSLVLRADSSHGLNRYGFEVLPRIAANLLAFLLYRFEILMRETAVLGILGIATLGFYIDSAFAELRLDRAMLLIAAGVLLNLLVDSGSRQLRHWLRKRAQGAPAFNVAATVPQ